MRSLSDGSEALRPPAADRTSRRPAAGRAAPEGRAGRDGRAFETWPLAASPAASGD